MIGNEAKSSWEMENLIYKNLKRAMIPVTERALRLVLTPSRWRKLLTYCSGKTAQRRAFFPSTLNSITIFAEIAVNWISAHQIIAQSASVSSARSNFYCVINLSTSLWERKQKHKSSCNSRNIKSHASLPPFSFWRTPLVSLLLYLADLRCALWVQLHLCET